VGAHLRDRDEQLLRAGGYDHNFVLARDGSSVRRAARVVEPRSGRSLEVLTSMPGVQVYTGNQLTEATIGTSGRAYDKHAGIALETQQFPDAPNRPTFPSPVLRPGETFHSTTIYRLAPRGR